MGNDLTARDDLDDYNPSRVKGGPQVPIDYPEDPYKRTYNPKFNYMSMRPAGREISVDIVQEPKSQFTIVESLPNQTKSKSLYLIICRHHCL